MINVLLSIQQLIINTQAEITPQVSAAGAKGD